MLDFMGEFRMFNIMFTIMFGFIFIAIVITLIKGIGQWSKNNHSPRLTVRACVVGKRQDIHYRHHNNDGMSHASSSTTYYVTFEVESSDRLEFCVSGSEYGQLVEGDFGDLTFQGTRYLDFERNHDKHF